MGWDPPSTADPHGGSEQRSFCPPPLSWFSCQLCSSGSCSQRSRVFLLQVPFVHVRQAGRSPRLCALRPRGELCRPLDLPGLERLCFRGAAGEHLLADETWVGCSSCFRGCQGSWAGISTEKVPPSSLCCCFELCRGCLPCPVVMLNNKENRLMEVVYKPFLCVGVRVRSVISWRMLHVWVKRKLCTET